MLRPTCMKCMITSEVATASGSLRQADTSKDTLSGASVSSSLGGVFGGARPRTNAAAALKSELPQGVVCSSSEIDEDSIEGLFDIVKWQVGDLVVWLSVRQDYGSAL
mmetsp:Transcript_18945/g.40699  ORF Transcript_18945/g.40699 Transcript_18945/m.40699 type:complete len:107 (+) Transcript_18945:721-1041(+)